MKTITSQDIKNAVDTLQQSKDGTVYIEIDYTQDGQTLYLVFGYSDGYDEGEAYQTKMGDTLYTLCAKLAFNVDDLQCDFEYDWYMPYSENGDVYDTHSAVTKDFEGMADYYNSEAKTIIEMMNNGEIVIN